MTNPSPPIEYVADKTVDDHLDRELRDLLSTCFTGPEGPQSSVFQHKRYYHEMPPHRWIIRGEDGTLAAHLALHERTLTTEPHAYPVGGIAEVCVHPAYRGRGYLKALVAEAHRWMRARDYAFSALFGASCHYGSSGYVPVSNLYHDARDQEGHLVQRRGEDTLVLPLSAVAWPRDEVAYLPGLAF